MKLHTLLDLRGNIPTVLFITPGRVHDVNMLDQLAVEAGAFYILDRGYLDNVLFVLMWCCISESAWHPRFLRS